MSTTLSITDTSPHLIDADALVVAVYSGADGPQPAPGTKDIDDALGGTLAGAGFPVEYHARPGGHDFGTWTPALQEALPWANARKECIPT